MIINLFLGAANQNILPIHVIFHKFLVCLGRISNIEKNRRILILLPNFIQTLDSCNLIPRITLFSWHIGDKNESGSRIIKEKFVFLKPFD